MSAPATTGARSRRPAAAATPTTRAATRASWSSTSRSSTTPQTDYALRGKHAKVACEKCHETDEEVLGSARRLQRLPQEGRRAQGLAGHQVRRLPHRERLEREGQVRPRQDALPAEGQARRRQVRRLPQERRRLQGRAAHLHRLPQEGRRRHQGPQGAVRREVRHAATAPRPGSRRPSTTTPTPSTRCAASTAATKCADCHTGHLYKEKLGHRLRRLPQEGRRRPQGPQGQPRARLRRLPRRDRLEGEGQVRPRQDRRSRCWASTAT